MTNADNLRLWTSALREPDRVQINGKLAAYTDDGKVGHCCMGVLAEKAGVSREESMCSEDEDTPVFYNEDGTLTPEGRADVVFYFGGEDAYPPQEAIEWLGLAALTGHTNLSPDWPKDAMGKALYRARPRKDGFEEALDYACDYLNDTLRLTFSQIADLLDYFGVRAV